MNNSGDVIVMFMPRDIKTGGERYLAEIYNHFIKHSFCVCPVYFNDIPKWPRHFGLIIDCLYSNFWLFWKIKRYGGLRKVILFEDFHLHPRLVLCNIMMKLVNRNIKIVALMQLGAFYHDVLKNGLLRNIDRFGIRLFFRKSDKILCNSNFTQREVVAEGVPLSKTEVVYCGIEGFDGQYPNVGNKRDCQNILFVGQCAAYKGLVYLLKAASLITDRKFVLNIVGNIKANPVYFKKVAQLVKELSLEKKVIFHGHVSDKIQLACHYMKSDLFVLPSLIEGFGIVLLEAMSFGIPIISTTAGSIPELVKDEENGLLVPPADAEALAAALKRVMNSSELRHRLGANGRNFFDSNRNFYSWDKTGERVLSALSELR